MIPNFKVLSKTFLGATTQDMTDYVKPSMNHERDIIFCRSSTKDIYLNPSAQKIATSIMELASSMKPTITMLKCCKLLHMETTLTKKVPV